MQWYGVYFTTGLVITAICLAVMRPGEWKGGKTAFVIATFFSIIAWPLFLFYAINRYRARHADKP